MLKTTYNFKNFKDSDKFFLEDYVEKKIERINKLIKRYQDKDIRLEIKSEFFSTKSACRVDFVLHLPDNILRAAEDDHTLAEAVDLAMDKLIIQLRKIMNKN